MASYNIEKRRLASGDYRYKCVVREKSKGKIIHNESKTFSKKNQSKLKTKTLSAGGTFWIPARATDHWLLKCVPEVTMTIVSGQLLQLPN